jgi:hypothetical protein
VRWPLLRLTLLFAALSAGCEADNDPPAEASPAQTVPPASGTSFDPHSCGTVTGFVTWVGPVPTVMPALQTVPRADGSGLDSRPVPLANAPRIDRNSRGVEGAVVYLRGVNPASAKPWDLPPVAVEFRGTQLLVRQGERLARAGFVRRGDSVSMQSAEPAFHLLRARGAAFFTLAFPEPGRPLSRTFDSCGRVELTSADGSYWQAADLFVCDHPYYAVTDAEGRFKFNQVPAGRYEVVAWHPSWEVVRAERNPETGLPSRLVYAPALERARPVAVAPARTALANLTLPK